MKFYFTYGSSGMAYEGGWTEVEAPSRATAVQAYVGVHSGTDRPKGSLANAELRDWRKATHARFDPLWRDGPFKKRNAAYRWLSEQMKLPIEQTHIGMFTVEQCKAALEIINKGVTV